MKSIPAQIQELHATHVSTVAEAVVRGDLEPVFFALDQLLEMRALMLRLEDPQTEAQLQRIRGAVDELNALRDCLSMRLAEEVATRKVSEASDSDRLRVAREWLSVMSGNAGAIG